MRVWFLLVYLVLGSTVHAESPLYWAIANNDALAVWNLANPAPEVLEENGLSPEAWAVARGSAEVVEVLVWRSGRLDRVDAQGRNLLYGAVGLGRMDLVERLLREGLATDVVDAQGRSLIHAAATARLSEALRWLLVGERAPITRSNLGRTALMEACGAGRAGAVALLLRWGEVPEDEDYLGRSVRDYALSSGDQATLELIDEALRPWSIAPDGGAPPP